MLELCLDQFLFECSHKVGMYFQQIFDFFVQFYKSGIIIIS